MFRIQLITAKKEVIRARKKLRKAYFSFSFNFPKKCDARSMTRLTSQILVKLGLVGISSLFVLSLLAGAITKAGRRPVAIIPARQ